MLQKTWIKQANSSNFLFFFNQNKVHASEQDRDSPIGQVTILHRHTQHRGETHRPQILLKPLVLHMLDHHMFGAHICHVPHLVELVLRLQINLVQK